MNSDIKKSDIAYLYDGSFHGMLCCIFESFEKKEMPMEITSHGHSLFSLKAIETDETKAERVMNGIINKISSEAFNYVKCAYLCEYKDKELAAIRFVRAGFRYGAQTLLRLADEEVMTLVKTVRLLFLENRRWIQFIRFSEYNDLLISIIEPENRVLPLLASHFVHRFPGERFMVYDRTHREALIYENQSFDIVYLEDFRLPEAEEEEQKYRRLWRMFYDTIEIKERHNERCRMNFMPKKYWKNMTEFTKD